MLHVSVCLSNIAMCLIVCHISFVVVCLIAFTPDLLWGFMFVSPFLADNMIVSFVSSFSITSALFTYMVVFVFI